MKVNFEKTYDSVDWEFLYYMMERLGLCAKWSKSIKGCLEYTSISILVNGSSTHEFIPSKGIRQVIL